MTAAVSSTLAKLTSVQSETQVQVKRKYKLSDKKTVRWWFVVRGTEEVLTKIENEWERVSLQTNWNQHCVFSLPLIVLSLSLSLLLLVLNLPLKLPHNLF